MQSGHVEVKATKAREALKVERTKIKGYIRREYVQKNAEGLKKSLVKRIKARRWDLQRYGRASELGSERTSETVKSSSKNIQSLALNLFPRKDLRGLRDTSKEIKRLGALEHLTLNFLFNGGVDNVEMLHLGQGLRRLKSLKTLTIVPEGNKNFSESLSSLAKGLRAKRNLLKLNMNLRVEFANLELKAFRFGLKDLRRIQEFDLSVPVFNTMNDDEFRSLKKGLMRRTSLRKLSLVFRKKATISDAGLLEISQGLKRLSQLRDLSLDFGLCNNITGIGLKSLGEGIKGLTSLVKLNFGFESCQGIVDIGGLGEGVKDFISLRSLGLNLESARNIDDEGFKGFSEGLKGLVSLRDLNMNLEQCAKITDISLISLRKSLQGVTSLEDIKLNCGPEAERNLTGEGLENLGEVVKNNPSLKNLTLNCTSCLKIDDRGLIGLGKGLQAISSLRNLNLRFSYCPLISGAGLSGLSEGLKAQTLLGSLDLQFNQDAEIDDGGIISLSEAMRKMSSLQKVSIFMYNCEKITDIGLQSMMRCTEGMSSLQNFYFNLAKCKLITSAGILGNVHEIFKKTRDVTQISFAFFDCQNVSNEAKTQLQTVLKNRYPAAKEIKVV